jgi:hypothetical protein
MQLVYLQKFLKIRKAFLHNLSSSCVFFAFKEWCQVVQTQPMDLGELQRQTAAAAQAKTMVSFSTHFHFRGTG